MAQCHIQWLYLAVHGCKTYLNLNTAFHTITFGRQPRYIHSLTIPT
jgi:hypothetical protein